jgi:hypothetical protein
MLLTETEVRDLEIFMRGLPARARDDKHAIRIFAELYAELRNLPEWHILRRMAEPSRSDA